MNWQNQLWPGPHGRDDTSEGSPGIGEMAVGTHVLPGKRTKELSEQDRLSLRSANYIERAIEAIKERSK